MINEQRIPHSDYDPERPWDWTCVACDALVTAKTSNEIDRLVTAHLHHCPKSRQPRAGH